MIDIDKLEKSLEFRRQFGAFDGDSQTIIDLIAEIRRPRGERKGHRKCPCGGDPVEHEGLSGNFWIDCDYCDCGTNTEETLDEAWAAWDGVEG
jgi:hypothetical protein